MVQVFIIQGNQKKTSFVATYTILAKSPAKEFSQELIYKFSKETGTEEAMT